MTSKLKRSTIWKLLILAVLFLVALEIYLRAYWGFCDNVLLMADRHFEYIQQPNQHRFRFRHHVDFNSFSMRSEEPDTSAIIVLGLGDSVIDGGVMVDQDSLATERLSKMLTKSIGRKVQVLNVGAGSWGPDNCYAYVQQHGVFNAKLAFLLASSHDAYDNMDFKPVIDKVDRYESKQYKLAIWELLKKYGIPRLKKHFNMDEFPPAAKAPTFNTGFHGLANYFKEKDIPFFIYLHTDQNEIAVKRFNYMGQDIIRFCDSAKVPLYEDSFNTYDSSDYRGVIHLNESGQAKLAIQLYPIIFNQLQQMKIF